MEQKARHSDTRAHNGVNAALEWLMRGGYAARGAVYVLVGVIALFAAINGGEAEGSTGALAALAEQSFGVVLLVAITAGLFCYALWRFVDAAIDLEDKGNDGAGLASRFGQFTSGAVHAVLGIAAISILIKGGGGSGSGAENWTAALIGHPLGRAAIIGAGLFTFGVGVYMFIKAYKALYRKQIRLTDLTEKLAPAVRFGLFSHGYVLLIIGAMIAWAGVSADPEKAAGLGEALKILETQNFGRILLGVTGLGLASFSVYCFVTAAYRISPQLDRAATPESLMPQSSSSAAMAASNEQSILPLKQGAGVPPG